MPQYTVTVNTFTAGTGHVNITFSGPGYNTATWGNNITDGNWRVQNEDVSLGRSDRFSSAAIELSHGQFSSLVNFITNIVNGPNNNYGLFGLNCVDFIRDALEQAGQGNQVAGLLSQQGLAVNAYAYATDWMHANGLGFMADGIGAFVGNMGELGTAIGHAAVYAYNAAADAVSAAYNFVVNVAQNVMEWGAFAWNAFTGMFSNFGKDLPGEQPEVVTPAGRPGPLEEVSDDAENDGITAMFALERLSKDESEPYSSGEENSLGEPQTSGMSDLDEGLAKMFVNGQDWAVV